MAVQNEPQSLDYDKTMKEIEFQKLIDPNKYQVFILHCPCSVPLNFASHPWFVCNEKGKVSRWEVRYNHNKKKNWGHLHMNFLPPFSGIEIIPFNSKAFWQGKILKQVEGILARKMIKLIKISKENYPHSQKYSLIGTNSNTYAKWVLSHFPELNFKLPWNSFGKNAK